MAIQIRNGTNTEWESNNSNIVVGEPAIATDAERFFVGTASGDYAEFANLDVIAPAYDTSTSYVVGDVINRQGKLYLCNTPCSGAFNVSYWDEKSLAEILKDLENEIDYAQYEIGYASGELITIDNGASEIPVKDLTLDIEAVQDLHGYDHPWVGGAGKNKLEVTGTSTTTEGITFNVSQDGTITVSGAFQKQVNFLINATCYLKAGDYIFNGLPSAPSWTTFQMYITVNGNKYASVSGTQFTVDTDGGYPVFVSIYGAISGTLTFKPMIRLASETDATFEPYSNICPISGWDEVNVNVSGVNLWDEEWESGDINVTNGSKRESTSRIRSKNFIPVRPSTTYYSHNAYSNAIVCFYDVSKGWVSPNLHEGYETANNTTFTTPSWCYYIMFYMNGNTYNHDISINYPSTDHDYHAYNGQTYTTAVNVWDEDWEVGYISVSNGNNSSSSVNIRSKNYISVLPNTRYYLKSSVGTVYCPIIFYDANKNFVSSVAQTLWNRAITTPSNASYMRFYMHDSYGTTYNHDISINFPADNTQYIPYKGSTATQNYMDTFGNGVYGGTLDVTTGVLTVTWIGQKFSELTGLGYTGNYFYAIPSGVNAKKIGEINIFSSIYKNGITGAAASMPDSSIKGTTANGNIFFKDSRFTTTSALLAEVGNETVCFELATPQVVQLTPTQIRTVLGTNNLWNQMNSNNELAYRISNALN